MKKVIWLAATSAVLLVGLGIVGIIWVIPEVVQKLDSVTQAAQTKLSSGELNLSGLESMAVEYLKPYQDQLESLRELILPEEASAKMEETKHANETTL
ncbi:hypothetical protein GW916_06680 [bacterium]|nr:hypothetical protein [bacterium]